MALIKDFSLSALNAGCVTVLVGFTCSGSRARRLRGPALPGGLGRGQ